MNEKVLNGNRLSFQNSSHSGWLTNTECDNALQNMTTFQRSSKFHHSPFCDLTRWDDIFHNKQCRKLTCYVQRDEDRLLLRDQGHKLTPSRNNTPIDRFT